jgi:Cof subfamily protein (haloacid dehalogenase superfamily)
LSIKLLAIDVDGTLLDSRGRIPQPNIEALNAAADRGITIAIVTGRSYSFALPAVEPLADPLTLVVHNGAIARMRAGATLLRRLLPSDIARTVLSATSSWRDCALMLFDRPAHGQLVYDRLDWNHPNRVRFRDKNRSLLLAVETLEDALTEDPIQIAFNGTVDAMRSVVQSLAAHPQADQFSVSLTEYQRRDFSLVDICAADTTKGATLARLAELLAVDRSEVLAVGDNFNDREMLAWAGVGVVMGNATPEMQQGFEVTGTNDEAGLAQAIRRFAL